MDTASAIDAGVPQSNGAAALVPEASKRIKLMLAGDISPGEHYFTMGHGVVAQGKRHGFDGVFDGARRLLASADVGFANLEGVLSANRSHPQHYGHLAFRGEPAMAPALARAGFKVVSIANNHVMQHGRQAFDETLACLRESGVQPCGERAENEYSCKPVIIQMGGAKLGFLAYSAIPDAYCKAALPYARFDLQQSIRDIADLRQRVTFVIVSVHIGEEGRYQLPAQDIAALRALNSGGADVVAAHHTHLFQRVEKVGDGIICHNLGNFVFDLNWHPALRSTSLVEVGLDPAGGGASVHCHPFFIDGDFIPRPSVREPPILFAEHGRESDVGSQRRTSDPRWLQLRKCFFFLRNLHKGATRHKVQFIADKFVGLARRIIVAASP